MLQKQLIQLIQNPMMSHQLEIPGCQNESGCKVLRVDGRKCVPYNNLSLQPETCRPLLSTRPRLWIPGKQSSRKKNRAHDQMDAMIYLA
jgi:hypothetical protein